KAIGQQFESQTRQCVAFVVVNLHKKFGQVLLIHTSKVLGPSCRQDVSRFEFGRRVPGRKIARDPKTEDLTDSLMCSLGNVARSSFLSGEENVPNVSGFDGIDEQMSDRGKDISLQPIDHCVSMPRRLSD